MLLPAALLHQAKQPERAGAVAVAQNQRRDFGAQLAVVRRECARGSAVGEHACTEHARVHDGLAGAVGADGVPVVARPHERVAVSRTLVGQKSSSPRLFLSVRLGLSAL